MRSTGKRLVAASAPTAGSIRAQRASQKKPPAKRVKRNAKGQDDARAQPSAASKPSTILVKVGGPTRCSWCTGPKIDPLYVQYHDEEWGREVRDDQKLFEKICLEGAQSGLSWWTILSKRENYRRVFHGFEITKVAQMTDAEIEAIMLEPDAAKRVVRHRGKLLSTRSNAQAALDLIKEKGSLSDHLWSFAPASPHNTLHKTENPNTTPESEALSKDLKKRGFRFVGPTTMYALMQSVGMVNDHQPTCFLYEEGK